MINNNVTITTSAISKDKDSFWGFFSYHVLTLVVWTLEEKTELQVA